MWFRRFLTLAVLLVLAGGMAEAQIYDVEPSGVVPSGVGPWNRYVASRIPDAYTPIIGVVGTTLIPGSNNATSTQSFNLALPFPYKFIGNTYSTGFILKIGANGYISFQTAPGTGVPSLDQDGYYYMIMPYWSDIQEKDCPEGGIYYRVDGVTGDRVLTVEWRAQGAPGTSITRNPGQFQAKLFERSGKMEFFYSSNSIDRGAIGNTAVGATVGIKYVGFYRYDYPPGANNQTRFMLMLPPDVVRDTVSLQRTRHFYGLVAWMGIPNWTFDYKHEIQAIWPIDVGVSNAPSRYWHYQFPTLNGVRCGYRITPVDNDVATDSVLFTPARPGNAYTQNAIFQLGARFRNIGFNSQQNVPVQVDIYRGNTLLESRTGVAFPTATPQGQTSLVTFSPVIGAPTTTLPGTYTAKVYTKMTSPVDQDYSNDTIKTTFYVSFPNDPMAYDLISPVPYSLSFPVVYPVNFPVPVEGRFLNIGTNTLHDVEVGYTILDNNCVPLYTERGTVRGDWAPLEYRDVTFGGYTPTQPGTYYVQLFVNLDNDDQRSNDTLFKAPACGRSFTVRYEIEVEARPSTTPGVLPTTNGDYPDGRPLPIRAAFVNNGITDATNVPARVEIRKGDCFSTSPVYSKTITVTTVPGEASGLGAQIFANFPDFVPQGAGVYCITAIITDPQDPLHSNDTSRWTFSVKPRLSGTIYVGVGERFRTIQEANDSLYRYGVAGNVNFKLVDDSYIVRPSNNDPSLPALDGRGDVIGSSSTAIVTWSAVDQKTNVDIRLKSPSGIGIIYGQRDTLNPTGWQVWDGGARKVLHFIMDTAGPIPASKSIPFFFGQGASNFAVKNVRIDPATVPLGRKTATYIPLVKYNPTFANSGFTYDKDESVTLATSAAIMLRNVAPQDANFNNPQYGNGRSRDTLRNQNNSFDGNVIRDFAYGILSIGAGPLYRTGEDAYVEYSNQNNSFINNTITDVGRAGIAVVFEKNSLIGNNTITRVVNQQLGVPHAVGIWVSSGGQVGVDLVKSRGYSDNLQIDRNKISAVSTLAGNGAAIWAETTENFFSSNTKNFRFPLNANTNFKIWNNMMWNYVGPASGGQTAGIGLTPGGTTRIDYVNGGNRVENNTIFNQVASSSQEYGIGIIRATGSIRNNIISILTPATANPIGLGLQGPNMTQAVNSDYNLFWVPNGYVGALANLSIQGYNLPSPPFAKTLNQWRALTGLDQNSVEGNITTEFVSTTPGSENLHIRTGITGSLANNRGANITDIKTDIDNDPRGSGGVTSRYDIGADEFNGLIRNNDLQAEDVLAPFGYRAPTGQFSDAEYLMVDSMVSVTGRFRNVGGLPQLANTVRLNVEYWNGSGWIGVSTATQTSAFNVAEAKAINFGTVAPRSLMQTGVNDPYYGLSPNVTPIYRFRVTSGTDDFAGNNIYEKSVRFYVRRSTRSTLVAVETRQAAMPVDAIGKSNKLNTDTLIAALDSIRWQRADGAGLEDYDLFDRDKWPVYNLDFTPWRTVVWEQGAEPQGMEPQERVALKTMLSSGDQSNRRGLVIAGQDIARIHDVALTSVNGNVADQDWVRNYLRAEYRGNTNPSNYSNRVIRGVAINPGKYERIVTTGVVGDNPPVPSLVRPTTGDGIARPTHHYYEQIFGQYVDSSAGVATAGTIRNVVFYGIDWRHYGRFTFEANRSGAQRLLLAGLDFINQYQGVVPVKVESFDAYQSGRKAVRVDWKTASETEVSSLEIERAVVERTESGDREGVYTVIAHKAPAGTATRGANYSITDQNVEAGTIYRYRLVSVGLDGSRTVGESDEVEIAASGEAAGFSLRIMPNPARSQAVVEVGLPSAMKVQVELYDVTGKLVQVLENGEVNNNATIELNVENLATGTYTVRMRTESGAQLVRTLTVQK